jgi:hypothetical protein
MRLVALRCWRRGVTLAWVGRWHRSCLCVSKLRWLILVRILVSAKRSLVLRRSTITWRRRISGDYRIALLLWRPIFVSASKMWRMEWPQSGKDEQVMES